MSDHFPVALENLITHLNQLPGIGKKTAQRLAIHILKEEDENADQLANAILQVKRHIHLCKYCFNITETDICRICDSSRRDRSTICVVEDIVDIFAIENSNEYSGLYHVLGGVISPLSGITPGDLRFSELLTRAESPEVREILLAINPSTEGEATMIYISKIFASSDKKITRIASGIPLGSHLEFVDNATIGRAILSRREV
ncbi:MAG: recombination protein RecR [Calditrichales bacterium]|nr:MAG: recombination protein RecR [Calditrichales bacterium]